MTEQLPSAPPLVFSFFPAEGREERIWGGREAFLKPPSHGSTGTGPVVAELLAIGARRKRC